ncbi:MAG: serine/threonine protein kinase [Phycisphaerales bacterium]|nr:serine/threonine protein kinase [Phycisphaerales bacterium]
MMHDQRWNELQRIFGGAVGLGPVAREAFLAEACGADPSLRAEIEALLAADARSESLFEIPPASEAETRLPTDGPIPAEEPRGGPVIPGFRIIRELGRGGMGIVYEAERTHPRRVIALKVLRSSFAQPSMRRRFEHEIHLLARLQHPGIAQIFDAGVAPSPEGPIPYFAMELVRGRPLHEAANEPTLGLRDRLELVAQIADALQHAHQKGVIHRDLKPGNILITPEGQPKILDFGVARAVDPDLQMTTIRTEIGQLIGTLPYMSPEQVAGDPASIDTRSDVYALGVVAYELIAGELPYDLRNKLIPEVVRLIQQQEPSRLSTANRACRGDVETIFAKALEKDRERRYQSVADLAADIRRFLADEPIVARPPSRAYLLRKFVKRHRALVGAAAGAGVILIAGTVASTTLAFRLGRTNSSLQAALLDADAARTDAQRQAASARAVNEFYTEHLLLAAAPEQSLGHEITIREALDDAAGRVDTELAAEPAAAATIHRALASVYRRLSMPERALPQSARALELCEVAFGPDDPVTLEVMNDHAQQLYEATRYDEAAALRGRAFGLLLTTLGEDHPATLRVAVGQASVDLERGEIPHASALLEHAVPILERREDTDPLTLLDARALLARATRASGRTPEAEALLRAAIVEARPRLDPDHPELLKALNTLGSMLLGRGDLEGALPLTRELAIAAERVLGPDHLNTFIARQNLARTLSALDRFGEAEPIWIDIIPKIAAQLPDPHPLTASLEQSYGIALAEHHRDADALPHLVEAHRQFDATLGGGHDETQRTIRWLVAVYGRLGDAERRAYWQNRISP